ncbi:ABC transporter permease subunit [Rathayibacter sp. VKM Ac-2803]|uniref:ABC transporter permease n=1 Tax=unclassified Rathayibacter TaxID=2609250 RepID=UPI00135CA66D|nr:MULTISPECIES: ABC transporter permease [unclassified Rathayibacter]MWV48758.1 ABC transporter permease subunit [Rathayibacter sp. VKM Ac-2803]MWV60366.1 ABC transporter permease subunit [Rathayibacter sp. VKM Ac-2754]
MSLHTPVVTDPVLPRVPRSERRRVLPHKVSVALRLAPFALVLILAVAGPSLAPLSATEVVGPNSQAPSAEHLAGTDSNGLDVLSRTLTAFQLDVAIALVVTAVATLGGIAIGLVSGMYDAGRGLLGFAARLLGRAVDLVQAIPVMIAGLVVVSFFGRNAMVITLSLAVVLLPFQARLTRTEVLRTRSDGYVDAARMSGESERRILIRHILRNSAGPAIENSSSVFGMAIIFSAALGFLGVGIPVPTAEWGSMLALGAPDAAVGRWWPVLFPAVALAFSVWAASLFVAALTDPPGRPRR